MSKSDTKHIKITASGSAFQQICNFVAISATRSPNDSLGELILNALFSFDEENTQSSNGLCEILKNIFGVDVPIHQIQQTVDQLIETGDIQTPLGNYYVLAPVIRQKIK